MEKWKRGDDDDVDDGDDDDDDDIENDDGFMMQIIETLERICQELNSKRKALTPRLPMSRICNRRSSS